MSKRVAVIGAGASGLTAMKCCVDEGLQPVCLERTDELGGLWRYTQQAREGQASVMRSTVINSSKEMTCFSDFPFSASFPNFMHNTLVWQYFQDYAHHFQLHQYIRYNTEVSKVTAAPDFETTGRWNLKLVDHSTGTQTTETFDAVMVCSGHHSDKNMPTFPGLGDFKGQVIHSHDYREPSGFIGKRIVVIGTGNSGGDIAVELGSYGQVFLSTRRGMWVYNRLSEAGGLPIDVVHMRRLKLALAYKLPTALLSFLVKRRLNQMLDHDLYRLTPRHPPTAQHPLVNDALGNCIANGSVQIKTDVKQFTASGVEFVDGSFVEDIDVVILATGYKFGFPFIDRSVIEVKDNRLPLYKYMFPPDLPFHTLAVIGCVQVLGALMPVSEMQSRLATRVFKGEVKLPQPSEMRKDIEAKETALAKRYVKSQRHTIQADYIPFMDELAELTGCKPNVLSLLMTDPALAWQVLMGPCTPCQYRLTGHGQWRGARHAIMTTMDRVRAPMATRPLPQLSDKDRLQAFLTRLVMLFVVVLVLVLVFV